jgi:hypothetical protein
MAMCQCERHGLQGAQLMCLHIQRAALDNRPIQYTTACGDDFFAPCMWLCNECKNIWDGIAMENDKEEFLGTLKVMCGDCFDEWNVKYHETS